MRQLRGPKAPTVATTITVVKRRKIVLPGSET
jgi:hypothetical protein